MAAYRKEPKGRGEQKKGIKKHALGNCNGMTGAQTFTKKYPGYQCNITEKRHITFQKLSVKE